MTLFIALQEIRRDAGPVAAIRFRLPRRHLRQLRDDHQRSSRLACRTLTRDLPDHITLAPLPAFELIGDLSVNTGKWMRGMSERLETWVHRQKLEQVDIDGAWNSRMEPELADKIYELERCIECGCCVAACGTARMHDDFVGAVGLNQIARFRLDPGTSVRMLTTMNWWAMTGCSAA
jgi:fumarate reductase iron-sulfur subunit